MEGREEPPRHRVNARLSDGGPAIGWFWGTCKGDRRCGRPPYDRLLAHPVLRADYRGRHSGTNDTPHGNAGPPRPVRARK